MSTARNQFSRLCKQGWTIAFCASFFACESRTPSVPKKQSSSSSKASTNPNEKLFQDATALVKTYCYQCHGLNQSNSGGLTNITDLAQKISQGLIVSGQPQSSKILERMRSSTSPMPPAGLPKPTTAEIDSFQKWIEAGAQTKFAAASVPIMITEDKILTDVGIDLIKEVSNPEDRKKVRYLTLAAAQNGGASPETIETLKQASAKLLNSLSKQQAVYKLKVSAKNPLLIRFSLDDLGWTTAEWDKIVKAYPYQIVPKDKKILAVLQSQTDTTFPAIRADWFIANASQPPLYYDILGSPKTLADFTKLLGINLPEAQRSLKIMRAGFNNSEVADFSRVIERVDSPLNLVMWHSYEFGTAHLSKNPFESPFGPDPIYSAISKTMAFQPDGKEVIYTLPNGFLAFYVSDHNNNRLDAAPTRARNTSVVSGVAIVGVACMTCHSQGLLEKRDQIRPALLKRTDLTTDQVDLLKAIYPEPEPFIAKLKADTLDYQNALKTAGVDFSQPDPVSRIFKSFNDSVNLSIAAGELGVSPQEVKTAIENSQALTNAISALASDGSVSRAIFSNNFQNLMTAIYGAN